VIFLLGLTFLSGAEAIARTYAANSPLTENPISENGNWLINSSVGNSQPAVQTTGGNPGLAWGNNSNSNDPCAILTGTWGPNQTVQGTVYTVSQTDSLYQEVGLHINMTITSSGITGYEVMFRCLPGTDPNRYINLARWDGPPGSYAMSWSGQWRWSWYKQRRYS